VAGPGERARHMTTGLRVDAHGDEPSPPVAERFLPADDEKIALFNAIIVNTATYELAGSSSTLVSARVCQLR
jgi:hypothetical protein